MKSLVRWQPFRELNSLQRQMNRMFDNCLPRTTPLIPFEESLNGWEFGPPVDIYEDDQRLTFKVEVPGIDEKDIKVEIENNVLTVRGERKLEKDVKEENFRRMSVIMVRSRVHSHFQLRWTQRRLRPTTSSPYSRSRCLNALKRGQNKSR